MWGFPWMMIFILLIVVFCVFFIFRGRRPGGCWSRRDDERRETPLEILKRRYAKGEITREDFERMKRDIE